MGVYTGPFLYNFTLQKTGRWPYSSRLATTTTKPDIQNGESLCFGVTTPNETDSSPSVRKDTTVETFATVNYHTDRFHYQHWCTTGSPCSTMDKSRSSFGTDLCYPCQRRWLILICSGRSASTTLTEMMDLLPNVRMGGENENFIVHIDQLLETLRGKGTVFTKSVPRGAWRHQRIPHESWSCAAQTLLETIIPPKLAPDGVHRMESDERTILGFKTIRLFKEDIMDIEAEEEESIVVRTGPSSRHLAEADSWTPPASYIEEKANLLKSFFPCARFVGNIRSNETAQLKSRKVLRGYGNDEIYLPRERAAIQALIEELGPERGMLMDSSRWADDIEELNKLVDWLGFSKECHFQELLEFNTKLTEEGAKRKQQLDVDPRCRYLFNYER